MVAGYWNHPASGRAGGLASPIPLIFEQWPECFPVLDRIAPPRLQPEGDDAVIISWALPDDGWKLVQSNDLNHWTEVSGRGAVVGGTHRSLARPIASQNTYSRLQRARARPEPNNPPRSALPSPARFLTARPP